MKTIFLGFCYQNHLIWFTFLGGMEVNKPWKFWLYCHQIFISVQTIRHLCLTVHFKAIFSLLVYQFNRVTKIQAWIICKMVYLGIFYCLYRPLIYVSNKWQPETKPLRTPYMLVRLELKPLLRYIVSYQWFKKQSSDQEIPSSY